MSAVLFDFHILDLLNEQILRQIGCHHMFLKQEVSVSVCTWCSQIPMSKECSILVQRM